MAYRCVATSVTGFVQQLAVAYLARGYWFYVTGRVPEGKDPADVDRKLMDRYQIGISKWARSRQKRQGRARVQYLRFDRFFVFVSKFRVDLNTGLWSWAERRLMGNRSIRRRR